MDFETTTCISINHIAILDEYARSLGVSLRTIIAYLVMFAAKKEKGIHCLKFYWGPPPNILKRAHI